MSTRCYDTDLNDAAYPPAMYGSKPRALWKRTVNTTDAICGLEVQSERDCRAIASLVSRRRAGNMIICNLNDPCG
jgi:hypothetical protein